MWGKRMKMSSTLFWSDRLWTLYLKLVRNYVIQTFKKMAGMEWHYRFRCHCSIFLSINMNNLLILPSAFLICMLILIGCHLLYQWEWGPIFCIFPWADCTFWHVWKNVTKVWLFHKVNLRIGVTEQQLFIFACRWHGICTVCNSVDWIQVSQRW